MRPRLLSSACLLAFLAPCVKADQWAKTFLLTGTPELRLQAEDASITVTAEDRKDIDARVTTAGWKLSGNGVRVVENHGGNLLQIQVVIPQLNFAFSRHSVKIELKVPREINCELKAGLGGVTLSGLKGKTVIVSKAGTIEAKNMDGKLEATTEQGKIRAAGRFDLLTLRSGYGTVDVEAASGSRMFSEWRLSTDNGNITLHLQPDFSADLDAKTDAGHITVDLPYTITGTPDRRASAER